MVSDCSIYRLPSNAPESAELYRPSVSSCTSIKRVESSIAKKVLRANRNRLNSQMSGSVLSCVSNTEVNRIDSPKLSSVDDCSIYKIDDSCSNASETLKLTSESNNSST